MGSRCIHQYLKNVLYIVNSYDYNLYNKYNTLYSNSYILCIVKQKKLGKNVCTGRVDGWKEETLFELMEGKKSL